MYNSIFDELVKEFCESRVRSRGGIMLRRESRFVITKEGITEHRGTITITTLIQLCGNLSSSTMETECEKVVDLHVVVEAEVEASFARTTSCGRLHRSRSLACVSSAGPPSGWPPLCSGTPLYVSLSWVRSVRRRSCTDHCPPDGSPVYRTGVTDPELTNR